MTLFDFFNKAFGIFFLIFLQIKIKKYHLEYKNEKMKNVHFCEKQCLIFFLDYFLENFTLNDTFWFFYEAFGIFCSFFCKYFFKKKYYLECTNLKTKNVRFCKKQFLNFFLDYFLENFTLNDTFWFFWRSVWDIFPHFCTCF